MPSATRSVPVVDDHSAARHPMDLRPAVSGMVVAAQALVLSGAVVVLPVILAYLVSPAQAESGWGRSVTIGTSFWLLGHGVPLRTGGGLVTMVPVGLTVIALVTCFASARRSAHTSMVAWAIGVLSYTTAIVGIAYMAGSTTTAGLVWAVLGGLMISAVGMGSGILARSDAPALSGFLGWASRVPAGMRVGIRAGAQAVCLVIGVSALLVMLWIIAGRSASNDIAFGLAPGTAGGILLALAQSTMVLNLVMWAASWLAGPGFFIGPSSEFTVTHTQSTALPAVPLLGALPGPHWTLDVTALAPGIFVLVGVIVGFLAVRRAQGQALPWIQVLWFGFGVAATAGLIVGLLTALASGSVGPLHQVGASGWLAGGAVAAEVACGAVAVLAIHTANVPSLLRRPVSREESA